MLVLKQTCHLVCCCFFFIFLEQPIDRAVTSAPSKEQDTKTTPMPKINTLIQKETSANKPKTQSTTSTIETKSPVNEKTKKADGKETAHTSRSPDKRVADKPLPKEEKKEHTKVGSGITVSLFRCFEYSK